MIYKILTIVLVRFQFNPLINILSLFDDAMFDLIVTQTNLYFCQKTGKTGPFTKLQIEAFTSVEIYMGIVKMSAYTGATTLAMNLLKI